MVLRKEKDGSITSHTKPQQDIITVRLNVADQTMLNQAKQSLEQSKDSTALKQLAWIGYYVVHNDLTGNILNVIYKNKRNNKRQGIIEFE